MINLLIYIFFYTFLIRNSNYYIPDKRLLNNYLNIKKKYNHNKFLNNNLTKVYIHIEPLVKYTNIYHIGITFKTYENSLRYDIGSFDIKEQIKSNVIAKNILWGISCYNLNSIEKYENELEYNYILGIYDCRHYVRDLTNWSTGIPSPIWELDKIYMDF